MARNSASLLPRAGFLTGAALAFGTSRASAQSADATLRVGGSATDGFGEVYYAREMGFFTKAGLDVEVVSFGNSGRVASAVVGNAIAIGPSSPISLANAYLRGIPVAYIAGGPVYSSAAPTLGLCVAADSTLQNAKDFEGKTISVNEFKGPTHLAVLAWLARNGADYNKVKFIELLGLETGPAIKRGSVAGAAVPEPFMSTMIANGDARLFAKCFDEIGDGVSLVGWFVRTDWLQKNRDDAKRFTGVIYETARWANANRAQTGEILQKYSRISTATLRTMTRAVYGLSLEPSMIDPTLRLAAQYKFTDRLVAGAELIAKL